MDHTKLYVVKGLGPFTSDRMETVYVEAYEIDHETPKRWYVKQRGGLSWFSKTQEYLFTDKDALSNFLSDLRARLIERAKRTLRLLECTEAVGMSFIPPNRPDDCGDIEIR